MDDEHTYPMNMHSNQPRRTYHPPEMVSHHPSTVAVASSTATHAPILAPMQMPEPTHRDDIDAPGEIISHSDDWNRLDTFQTRLEGLQYTLNRTMSKWAREQDANQEISHHEGLGM